MKPETYWNYTYSSKGQTETWQNKKLEATSEIHEIKSKDINEIGKYSSLFQAIKGFINDELNSFSPLIITYDENDQTKFKLKAEVWCDYLGNPVNDVIYRQWKKGEIKNLTHTYLDVIFIKHINEQTSIQEFAQIMQSFPQIKTADEI